MSDIQLWPSGSRRKAAIHALFEKLAPERESWIRRNEYYHAEDTRFIRFLIPEDLSVLEIGCGTGQLLAALRPRRGVGIDFSASMIESARRVYPAQEFILGDAEHPETLAQISGTFDWVVFHDTFGLLDDCQTLLGRLLTYVHPDSRVLIVHHNHFWEPVLRLGEMLRLKMPQAGNSWLSNLDVHNLLELAGYETVQGDRRQILPFHLGGVGRLVNRFVATLPLIQKLCVRNYVVARPLLPRPDIRSASVIIPCRNESGNIAPLIARLPEFSDRLEIIFVEGHSSDDTYGEVERTIKAAPGRSIQLLQQSGIGKADAVRTGAAAATGDIVMILDADMTVAPEDMPKVFDLLASNRAEFVNGTRFVYPMEGGAMRFLNLLGNRAFSLIFSWLLSRRFTDTLCGTKAMSKAHWNAIMAARCRFKVDDPFGDFDMILGASRLALKTAELPLRYGERRYGETQISRFRHGWHLLRMAFAAYRLQKTF